ncbi:CHAT domain-containing protein [Aspergillus arachidicola]|uniref:CHAT domain-containing protein n=1 Tax=Aspergillus arachidicola TaxID=656916 RepID=A0A5N6XSW7_9EURO|nr:CHAT domain-containing protein [Aspergillus arachidicola]
MPPAPTRRTYPPHAKYSTAALERVLVENLDADTYRIIEILWQFYHKTPEGHPLRIKRLEEIGLQYAERCFTTHATVDDITKIIELSQQILDIMPEDHPDRGFRLHTLAVAHQERYDRLGTLADLQAYIERGQDALDKSPSDNSMCAWRRDNLDSLGDAYRERYDRSGAIADLQAAIQRYQEALEITPKNRRDWARESRYRHQIEDIRPIEVVRQLHDPTQDEYARDYYSASRRDTARRHQSLGLAYKDIYERTGTITDIESAIQHLQTALEYTSEEDSLDRADLARHLAEAYRKGHGRIGEMTNLELSIEQLQKAVDERRDDELDQPYLVALLAYMYHKRYHQTGVMEDLEAAIQHYQKALNTSPKDHRNRASKHHDCGVVYQARYWKTGAITDRQTAIYHYQEALGHSLSTAVDRLRPGLALLGLCIQIEDWTLAYETAATTISLIPLLDLHSIGNSDKQNLLTELVGLASDSAAVTLMAGETPYEAIRLLELSRGVLIGSLSEIRADVSDLEKKYPQPAEEYIMLRDILISSKASMDHSDPLNGPAKTDQVDLRYNTGQKLQQLIQDIRQLPGFDQFLLAPFKEELMAAAAPGPIVIINVNKLRCDALLIEKTEIRTLRLPHLRQRDILAYARDLDTPESLSTQLLEWLWDTLAEPVLQALGFIETPTESWPRMWWIPTGPLAKLPIHAAGYHSRGSSHTVLDRVISSYSSSVRALTQSRQQQTSTKTKEVAISRKPEKAVLLGMPELQYASREIEILDGLCRSMELQVCKPPPCREDLLAALKDCDIFHFAGHGRTDLLDPLNSALILLNGEVLTVASLLETNLHSHHPFIAYLSACGTGQVNRNELIDESLHLISACQLAGFQHVIGTLWKVDDKTCMDAASITYEWIKKRDMNEASVSEGVHHASRSLRYEWVTETMERGKPKRGMVAQDKDESQEFGRSRDQRDVVSCDDIPLYWVPFVHFGT